MALNWSFSVSYCPQAYSLCPVWFGVEKEVQQTRLSTSSKCYRGVIYLYSCPSQAVAGIYTGEMRQYLWSIPSAALKSSVISVCSYFYWLYIVCVLHPDSKIEFVELWFPFVLLSTFQIGCLEESQCMLKICLLTSYWFVSPRYFLKLEDFFPPYTFCFFLSPLSGFFWFWYRGVSIFLFKMPPFKWMKYLCDQAWITESSKMHLTD